MKVTRKARNVFDLKKLPTSFKLKPEQVDRLKKAARRILTESDAFQRLVEDLQ